MADLVPTGGRGEPPPFPDALLVTTGEETARYLKATPEREAAAEMRALLGRIEAAFTPFTSCWEGDRDTDGLDLWRRLREALGKPGDG